MTKDPSPSNYTHKNKTPHLLLLDAVLVLPVECLSQLPDEARGIKRLGLALSASPPRPAAEAEVNEEEPELGAVEGATLLYLSRGHRQEGKGVRGGGRAKGID